MMALRSGKAQTKPLDGVAIDLSHSLARGLVDCWPLRESANSQTRNVMTGVLSTSTTIPPVVGSLGGLARDFDGATSSRFLDNAVSAIPDGTDYTVWSLCIPRGSGLTQNVVDSDGFAGARRFQLRVNTSNQFEFIAFNTAEAPFIATGSTVALGTLVSIGGTVRGTVVTVWGNGVPVGSTTLTGTIKSNAPTIRIGNLIGGSPQEFNGQILMAARWNRALTAFEMSMLHAAPYLLFYGASPNAALFAPGSVSPGRLLLLLGVGTVIALTNPNLAQKSLTRRQCLTALLGVLARRG